MARWPIWTPRHPGARSGIGVVLDYVMNHSAAQHPAFVNANSGSGNAFQRLVRVQRQQAVGLSIYGGDPWRSGREGFYFAPFWDQMPDFNLKNPTVVSWHQDNLRFWLNPRRRRLPLRRGGQPGRERAECVGTSRRTSR